MKKLMPRAEYEQIAKSFDKGYCPLCSIETQTVLGESTHWYWVAALSPYWRYHTMLIPKEHKLDIVELSAEEFADFQLFYAKIKTHLLSLGLTHTDGKQFEQFILVLRSRENDLALKPRHLHIHIVPEVDGIERFILDDTAINVDIEKLALTS